MWQLRDADAPEYVVACDIASDDDGQFIAHARTDIPALLAEIRFLKEQNALRDKGFATLLHDFGSQRGLEPQIDATGQVIGYKLPETKHG